MMVEWVGLIPPYPTSIPSGSKKIFCCSRSATSQEIGERAKCKEGLLHFLNSSNCRILSSFYHQHSNIMVSFLRQQEFYSLGCVVEQ